MEYGFSEFLNWLTAIAVVGVAVSSYVLHKLKKRHGA